MKKQLRPGSRPGKTGYSDRPRPAVDQRRARKRRAARQRHPVGLLQRAVQRALQAHREPVQGCRPGQGRGALPQWRAAHQGGA